VTASGIYVIVVLGGRQRQVGARIERRVGQRRKQLGGGAVQRWQAQLLHKEGETC